MRSSYFELLSLDHELAALLHPDDAIRKDTGIVDLAAYSRGAMQLDIHELMNPKLLKPLAETSCTLTFPHECRLTPGHVKGDWNQVYGDTHSAPGS